MTVMPSMAVGSLQALVAALDVLTDGNAATPCQSDPYTLLSNYPVERGGVRVVSRG